MDILQQKQTVAKFKGRSFPDSRYRDKVAKASDDVARK